MILEKKKEVNVTSQGNFQAEELAADSILTKNVVSVLQCIDTACSVFRHLNLAFWKIPFGSTWFHNFYEVKQPKLIAAFRVEEKQPQGA